MDMDTAGTKSKLIALLNDFEEHRLDILVGTQMVTKGLDFDNVAFVGVLGADALTKFPDFRSGERAFQLLTQVAGRAGRNAFWVNATGITFCPTTARLARPARRGRSAI